MSQPYRPTNFSLGSAVYKVNSKRPNSKSLLLNLHWTRDITKCLNTRRKSNIGYKIYTTRQGTPGIAIRPKPDEKKGFKAVKVHAAGPLRDRVWIGVGTRFNAEPSVPSFYRFSNGTMYVNLPFNFANSTNQTNEENQCLI